MCANQSCKAPAFTCHEGNHADCTEHTHRVGKAKSDCTETQTLIARNDRRQSWPATCQTSSNEVEAHLHRPVECTHVSCICCYGSNETDLSAFYEMRGRYKIVRRIIISPDHRLLLQRTRRQKCAEPVAQRNVSSKSYFACCEHPRKSISHM